MSTPEVRFGSFPTCGAMTSCTCMEPGQDANNTRNVVSTTFVHIDSSCFPLTAVTKAVGNFENGIKEVNVRLSANGGDRGAGAP